MYPDLLFHYGVDLVDVIEGRGPSPSLVISLIRRLPDTSLTVALASGGREFFGWGAERHLLADIYDATNQTTRAAGNWEKKAPDIPMYPRPGSKESPVGAKPRKSVKELYAQFSRK